MMKKNIAFLVFVIGFSIVFSSCVNLGNGNINRYDRALNQFESIRINGSPVVRFHTSQYYRAVINIDSNLERFVDLSIRNNTLTIGMRGTGSYLPTKFEVDIYSPSLTSVSVSGSGHFRSIDTIASTSFKINISGSGIFDGTIECDNFSANISGSGEINLKGFGNNSDIIISGSGNLNGIEFQTNNVNTRISGSGNMYISALEYINANVSGSGSIIYRGNPRIDFSGSGSGRIRSE
jgi:hypothetical protein